MADSTSYQIDRVAGMTLATMTCPLLTRADADELVVDLVCRLRHEQATKFVLDMKQVEFMDSSCLGALVEFVQDLQSVRGRLGLVGCQPNIAFLLRTTRLDSVLPMFDEFDEAARELG